MSEQPTSPEKRILLIPSRELRRVPFEWKHPVDEEGNYIPLARYETFEEIHGDSSSKEDKEDYEEEKEEMMPDFSDTPNNEMGISAYETYTDGTPISAVFPNTSEGRFSLVKHCAENVFFTDEIKKLGIEKRKADVAEWAQVLFGKMPIIDTKSGKIILLGENLSEK